MSATKVGTEETTAPADQLQSDGRKPPTDVKPDRSASTELNRGMKTTLPVYSRLLQ